MLAGSSLAGQTLASLPASFHAGFFMPHMPFEGQDFAYVSGKVIEMAENAGTFLGGATYGTNTLQSPMFAKARQVKLYSNI